MGFEHLRKYKVATDLSLDEAVGAEPIGLFNFDGTVFGGGGSSEPEAQLIPSSDLPLGITSGSDLGYVVHGGTVTLLGLMLVDLTHSDIIAGGLNFIRLLSFDVIPEEHRPMSNDAYTNLDVSYAVWARFAPQDVWETVMLAPSDTALFFVGLVKPAPVGATTMSLYFSISWPAAG